MGGDLNCLHPSSHAMTGGNPLSEAMGDRKGNSVYKHLALLRMDTGGLLWTKS